MKTRKLVVIGLFMMVGLTMFVYRPDIKTYTLPEIESGFFMGARTQTSFVFFFYDHPNEENVPLKQFDTLYSNTLFLYTLGFQEATTEELKVRMYHVEVIMTENGTREDIIDENEFSYTLSVAQYKVIKNTLELPRHDQEYKIELYTKDGLRIFVFNHLTHPVYLPAEQHTLGSLFLDRLAYIISALLLSLVALGFARFTVDKKQVVPQMGMGIALWFMTLSGIILFIGANMLIYVFGIIDLWWTYLPLFISSYLFGFAVLKPNMFTLYFMKTLDSHMPTKELDSINVVKRQNTFYNGNISWKDFLLGREEKLEFGGEYYWYWRIKDSDDRVYIHKSITKNDLITIELAGVHFKDVDEFLSELITVTNISEQKENFRRELLELLAKFEVVVDRRALEFTKKYMELMMMEEGGTEQVESLTEGDE